MSAKPLVYLAGAIAGLEFDDVTDWRVQAKYELEKRGIEALNPMRGKEALGEQNAGRISLDFHDYEKNGPFFHSRGIMTRDFNDVRRCDVLLVNLLGLKKPSLGTIMEIGWAYAMQKPTVVAMEERGNPHDGHPMIYEAIPFRFATMDEAIDAVASLLNR
jgi:nucleoside 2-deoxyribosyltransferase